MTTSLGDQLRRLKLPQTSILVDQKKRASILFDPKEAANKNRRTIYDIGHSGLVELIALDPTFLQFEETLFNPNSITLERSIETSQINELIDRSIKKFFQHLSPFLMLKPAHYCLEWLIRRFHIHEYNQNDIIALILPYHETSIFIKCIQTLNIKSQENQWKWMEPIQKPGVSLTKSVIINRAISDISFLKFICTTTVQTIKELHNRGHTLQTQINFYCTTIVGVIEYSSEINDKIITGILPAILKGLSSKTLDFASATLMIIAQLCSKIQLNEQLLDTIIKKICTIEFIQLHQVIVLVLIVLYETQIEYFHHNFPDHALITFINNKWLLGVLAGLSMDAPIGQLCVPILSNCLRRVQTKGDDWSKCKEFLETLIKTVHFSSNDARNIIRAVLDNYHKHEINKTTTIIELNDSDDGDEDMALEEDIESWYSEYLQSLERQYPNDFDYTIKETMEGKQNISESRKQALKTILAFRLKSSYFEDNSLIYENLYHHNAKNRIKAVSYIVKNIENLTKTSEGKAMVKECLLDRFNDDISKVIYEILKLSTKQLNDILGPEILAGKLLDTLNKCQTSHEDWKSGIGNVMKHLPNCILIDDFDSNRILLAVMPFMMPEIDSDVHIIQEILTDELCNNIPFLATCKHLKHLKKASEVVAKFQKLLQIGKELPTPDSIIGTYQDVHQNFFHKASNSLYFLVLLSASFKNCTMKPFAGLAAFELMNIIDKKFEFINSTDNWSKLIKQNKIPLSVYLDFIVSVIHGTKFTQIDKFDLNANSEHSLIFQCYYKLMMKSYQTVEKSTKSQYYQTLKIFLDHVFPSHTQKLQFLGNFFCMEFIPNNIESKQELQILSLKLFKLVVDSPSNSNYTINELLFIKVLIGLTSEISFGRQICIEIIELLSEKSNKIDENWQIFGKKLMKSKEEILMDCEQFPLILFTILSPARYNKRKENNLQKESATFCFTKLLEALKNKEITENYIKAKILNLIKHINSVKILENIIEFGAEMLQINVANYTNDIVLDTSLSDIFKLIIQRFDEITIEIINTNAEAWNFIVMILQSPNIYVEINHKIKPASAILMDAVDAKLYEPISEKYKILLIQLVLKCISNTENQSLPRHGNRLIKRVLLNGQHLLPVFIDMKNSIDGQTSLTINSKTKKRTSNNIAPELNALNNDNWKCGVALLECLQNQENLIECHVLISILFDILKKCLDFDEQTAVEYAIQLILSCLLKFCKKCTVTAGASVIIPENVLHVDLIVQCIRTTQNPQTHHHALLLLSQCALMIPQKVLHNMMDIFTFMGTSVVRHDDSYTIQIISTIIETVIPALVNANNQKTPSSNVDQDHLVIPVLKVFSDIILDVEEHRRLIIYTKLLTTLDATRYLWMFLCILFESHVMNDEKEKLKKKPIMQHNKFINTQDDIPKRITIALQMVHEFGAVVTLETCICLFVFLKNLPNDVDDDEHNSLKMEVDDIDSCIFNYNTHTAKQFRHFKYTILQFMSTISSSTEFLNSISQLKPEEIKSMKPIYQNFIIKILSYVPNVTQIMESNHNNNQSKYWKIMLHHCYDILNNSILLLSPDMLLVVVHGLMNHKLPAVRKKVIELLINKLQYDTEYFVNCNEENLLNLLQPLNTMINTILTKETIMENATVMDIAFIQQISLIALKLLSKLIAIQHIDEFKSILNNLLKIIKKRDSISKVILATTVLAITEISSNLRANSISHLPKFMPHLMEVLHEQSEDCIKSQPDNVCIAIVTGMQKLFETLPLFLGPYIVDIITSLINIWLTTENLQENDLKCTLIINKMKSIWSKISTTIPIRIVIPYCDKTYDQLILNKKYSGIGYLMLILTECFEKTPATEINEFNNIIIGFFMKTLEFRGTLKNYKYQEKITDIENLILNAFVGLILKLSENSFRPLYQKLYNWALHDSIIREKSITYFILSNKLAENLKSLFVLFAGDFIQDAANLLDKCNSNKYNSDELYFNNNSKYCGNKLKILIEYILKTLHHIFLYDSKGFINPHRFDILMQPIADQLENPIIIENEHLQKLLLKCIAQLVVVVTDDTLWKQLNYQVLLKTRSNQPEIRILAFQSCVEIGRKLGDDFSSLLPETVPFIAELFEDEQPEVESSTKKGVQELEKILGESLQRYF